MHKYIQSIGVFLGGGLIWNGCNARETAQEKKENNPSVDPCEDLSEVSEGEVKKREQFGYVKETPIPDNQCSNCNLWLPPLNSKPCGGCMLFQGPVYSGGYCTYWAPKV